ncbi:MAG: MoaD/ThiS family protein [archaeon]
MEVTVQTYASLKRTVGKKTLSVSLDDGATLTDLATALSDAYPDTTEELFDGDDLRKSIRIHYNGQVLSETDVELKDGDTVSLMPQIAGG